MDRGVSHPNCEDPCDHLTETVGPGDIRKISNEIGGKDSCPATYTLCFLRRGGHMKSPHEECVYLKEYTFIKGEQHFPFP